MAQAYWLGDRVVDAAVLEAPGVELCELIDPDDARKVFKQQRDVPRTGWRVVPQDHRGHGSGFVLAAPCARHADEQWIRLDGWKTADGWDFHREGGGDVALHEYVPPARRWPDIADVVDDRWQLQDIRQPDGRSVQGDAQASVAFNYDRILLSASLFNAHGLAYCTAFLDAPSATTITFGPWVHPLMGGEPLTREQSGLFYSVASGVVTWSATSSGQTLELSRDGAGLIRLTQA